MNADSPNAGLRLLSEAISPHMKACEAEKHDSLTKQVGKRRLFENELYQKTENSKNEDDKNLTRSLDKLVEQFLDRFGDKENENFSLIDLDFCAVRRRVYDVINVLEGVGMVTKSNRKNFYCWAGKSAMNTRLAKIRRSAVLETTNGDLGNISEIANSISENAVEDLRANSENLESDLILNHSELSNSSIDSVHFNTSGNTPNPNNSGSQPSSSSRNLSALTVRFIRLFFALRPINWTLTLDEAAERVACDASENSSKKSGSIKRRLYDITNVLLALQLIEKVHLTFGTGANTHRKGGFRWIDQNPSLGDNFVTDHNSIDNSIDLSLDQECDLQTVCKTPQKFTRNCQDNFCQTSPSLLKALIKDINAELEEAKSHDSICVSNACPSCHAHLSRAYPALCPHCRSHLPSVPSSSLCESSSLLLQSRQKLNFGSPKNSTGPRSAFTSPNVKIGSPLTSTPVAGVPAQMKASYLGGFPIHSTHINLVNANRKRKSSAPVFSNRMLQNSQIKLTPTPRGGFVNLIAPKVPNFSAASKTLNFGSPIQPRGDLPVFKKTPTVRRLGIENSDVFVNPNYSETPNVGKGKRDDSGLGISPALNPALGQENQPQ